MQVHPDGTADYIGHRPDQLDHGVRWICRTPDQDALGICLPATAEPEGYSRRRPRATSALCRRAASSAAAWSSARSLADAADADAARGIEALRNTPPA